MRVLISGASGLIGLALTAALRAGGNQPVALVRRAPQGAEVQWNPGQPLDPQKLAATDAIVHLAGKNVAGRWTEKFKQEVRESRVQGTLTLAKAAAEAYRQTGKPAVLVAASAIGYYGDRGEEVLTEASAPGEGFLADVCREWEAATEVASAAGIRVVNLRIGVVLASDGGALKPMLLPFKLGLGGEIGDGKQYWSWIALEDVVQAIVFALGNDTLRGPVNAVGPEPVRNAEFVKALGKALHRPSMFPLPAFVVRAVFGEFGEEGILGSARILPTKLEAAGYEFRHPQLEEALRTVLG